MPYHSSTSIIRFADDTVVLGLISNNDETAYLDEVERLHNDARTTVSLWMRVKLKSWSWTSWRDSSGPTLLLWSVGPLWRGWVVQVPRCKHLRGPDLDCTHSNTGQESQAKTVPSATAEEIQGLTSYAKNVLFRGHRKCTDSNTAKAELLKSSRTQTTLVTVSSFYYHLASASGAWWQKLRDWGGASSLRPSGS